METAAPTKTSEPPAKQPKLEEDLSTSKLDSNESGLLIAEKSSEVKVEEVENKAAENSKPETQEEDENEESQEISLGEENVIPIAKSDDEGKSEVNW